MMADDKPKPRTVQKKIRVTSTVWGLLDEISQTNLFGDGPSGAAATILERETTRMVTSGELKGLLEKAKLHEKSLENSSEEPEEK